MLWFVPNWIIFLEQNSSRSVSGVQSSPGNKRKWVSLPLEEASRDDGGGDKAPDGGPDTDATGDSPDPTSPNHTLHNNRAHDSSRSKWPAARCSLLFTSSLAGSASLFASTSCLLTTFPRCHLSLCRVCKLLILILTQNRMKACAQIYWRSSNQIKICSSFLLR